MNLDNLRADEALLRKELESAGAIFKGKSCNCPICKEKQPSSGIYYDDGPWKFKCHSRKCGFGGDVLDVRAKLNGTTVADELRKINDAGGAVGKQMPLVNPDPQIFPTYKLMLSRLPNVEDDYADLYAEPKGDSNFSVIRWRKNPEDKKRFSQVSKTAGGWWWKKIEGMLPIANRSDIATASSVVVVEGEKSVRALGKLGIIATTSPGGAGKDAAGRADWSPLAGKTITLWPDWDEPDETAPEGVGIAHMRDVQELLSKLEPRCRILWLNPAPLELPWKGDCVDLIERYKATYTSEEVAALVADVIADADPVGIAGEFKKELEAIIAGKRRAIDFPWQLLSYGARALGPGKVICVCGDAGTGKSLFVSNCLVAWNELGNAKACVYHLEDDRDYHLQRVLAQLEMNSNFTDNKWVEGNGEYVRAAFTRQQEQIENIGRCIWEAPQDQVSAEMLLAWMEARAKDGFEIIIIDPVTATASASQPWVQDLKFVTRAKILGTRYGSRFIFVTHPRTGAKSGKANHNDMSGGAAFPRFSHSVLWFSKNDEEAEYAVRTNNGQITELIKPNRLLHISKARDGPWAGRRIAYEFSGKSLTFEELGLVEKSQWRGARNNLGIRSGSESALRYSAATNGRVGGAPTRTRRF